MMPCNPDPLLRYTNESEGRNKNHLVLSCRNIFFGVPRINVAVALLKQKSEFKHGTSPSH